jgi:hypothetical protein
MRGINQGSVDAGNFKKEEGKMIQGCPGRKTPIWLLQRFG